MAYNALGGFPSQQLSFTRKNKKWRRQCVDFGDRHSLMFYHVTRKSVRDMRINYDLLNGRIHMEDLKAIVNPFGIEASYIPNQIQHYSIINSKLKVLEGEESRRLFDYRVVITNPNAVSEIEEEKNKKINEKLLQLISDSSKSEDEYNAELEKLSDYFTYEYQDKREVRANRLLNHYIRELEIPQQFNKGFRDAYTAGEELYQCDIVGGEPYIEKLNPREVRIVRSGTSSYVEDADMIIIEQYWSPGKIVEVYWDQLSKKDIDSIEKGFFSTGDGYDSYDVDTLGGSMDAVANPIRPLFDDWTAGDAIINPYELFNENDNYLPYDMNGNIRVLRVYWKSRRKIKKVKSYDPETGEEQFNFYPENYIVDPLQGEEEETFWINEAWEGTKIGQDIYINMRPRPIQYNRLSNPSRCHFGIIGSIYTTNGDQPYSMVDIMKPYAYLYDVIHDRLNKTLARNVGKVIKLDFAKVPKGWTADQWLYYIMVNGIAVENSAQEGEGIMSGRPVGALNNASSGVVDASLGTEISQYIQYLEWISTKIGDIAGISRQREGQISNRETVGGVERATLQSSHSTEWLFFTHESVKKRVLECLLETAKISLKGRKKKFEYILSDGSKQIVEIDGDEFAECDYGLVVDNSNASQELNQKLETLSQAGVQNGMSLSTVMRIFSTDSLAEKTRAIDNDEKKRQEMQQQEQQRQYELQQQQMQINAQIAQQQQEMQYKMHQEKLEAQILIAQINSQAEADRLALMNEEKGLTRAEELEYKEMEMSQAAKQFDAKMKQESEKLRLEKEKHKDDIRIKEKQLSISKNTVKNK